MIYFFLCEASVIIVVVVPIVIIIPIIIFIDDGMEAFRSFKLVEVGKNGNGREKVLFHIFLESNHQFCHELVLFTFFWSAVVRIPILLVIEADVGREILVGDMEGEA